MEIGYKDIYTAIVGIKSKDKSPQRFFFILLKL